MDEITKELNDHDPFVNDLGEKPDAGEIFPLSSAQPDPEFISPEDFRKDMESRGFDLSALDQRSEEAYRWLLEGKYLVILSPYQFPAVLSDCQWVLDDPYMSPEIKLSWIQSRIAAVEHGKSEGETGIQLSHREIDESRMLSLLSLQVFSYNYILRAARGEFSFDKQLRPEILRKNAFERLRRLKKSGLVPVETEKQLRSELGRLFAEWNSELGAELSESANPN